MKKKTQELVNDVRAELRFKLDEWLGNDYPDEGTEDYDTWQRRLSTINNIKNVEDIYAYAAEFEQDEDTFLGTWGL